MQSRIKRILLENLGIFLSFVIIFTPYPKITNDFLMVSQLILGYGLIILSFSLKSIRQKKEREVNI